MDSPDLQAKYQKLASEYSKLRAQNQVLKKAVIEEQAKTSQLQDNLKSRDQTSRKAEQELDSLTFRNKQLTKRLILLQDDLEHIQNKSRKGQSKQDAQGNTTVPTTKTASILDHDVYAEELESKIAENARLHAELSDIEIFYKNKISELEGKVEEVCRDATKSSEFTRSQQQLLENKIKKYEYEKTQQEVSAQHREDAIISLQNQLKTLKLYEQQTEPHADQFHEGTQQPPTSIREPPVVTPINLLLDGSYVNQSGGTIIREFITSVNQMCCGFISFFSSYGLLLKQSATLTPIQLKLIDQLNNEKVVWQTLPVTYEKMALSLKKEGFIYIDNINDFENMSKAVASCATSLRKLIPIFSEKWLCLKEGQDDEPWRSALSKLVSCWAALTPYLASLAAHNDSRTVLTPCVIGKILTLFSERLSKLHHASQELLTAWNLFTCEEKQGESVKRSLKTIEEALNRISSTFSEKVVDCWNRGGSNSSTPSSNISPGTPHITPHPSLSLLGSPDGSGWSASIQDGIHLADSEASLAQQLAQATSRLSKLEEEREHWRLEYQLLSHRFNKELKKSQQLEEQLKTAIISKDKSVDKCNKPVSNKDASEVQCGTASTSLVGEIVGTFGSAEEREREIRNHFTNRCSHLYMQLTASASQAALYQNECETLIRRLAISEESRVTADHEVDLLRRDTVQIQETLATTSRNYEEQISTMSDHLADLNEKITSQADLIEQLKFEMKKKGKR